MNPMMPVMVFGTGVFLLGFFLTRYFLKYAEKKGMKDLPNERSSHSRPTPRGGGAAIVIGFVAGLSALKLTGVLSLATFAALAAGSMAIGLTGWKDDQKSLAPRVRFSIHAAAALTVILILGPWFKLTLGRNFYWSNGAATLFIFFYVVWMINLYNFMDGIDGIAAGECVTTALILASLAFWHHDFQLASLYLLLAASSVGFMIYNWHPAKIFMGDVGSGMIGFVFASLSVLGEVHGTIPGFVSLIVLGVFIADSTLTLSRRFLAKKKVSQAHRDHAYQHAVLGGYRHHHVSMTVMAFNVFWLGPWAAAALAFPGYGLFCLVAAYAPLLGLAFYFKAGVTL